LFGGEKQKVRLIRAMIIQPDILILDESTQNLDSQNMTIIKQNIKKNSLKKEGR
jgi:ABC-type bacteriocin/lantibiotic exporter with double-glycine peptidase domain